MYVYDYFDESFFFNFILFQEAFHRPIGVSALLRDRERPVVHVRSPLLVLLMMIMVVAVVVELLSHRPVVWWGRQASLLVVVRAAS